MKKVEFRFFALKASLLISLLSILGFSACEEDFQPEYGVPAVRNAKVNVEQKNNDTIIVHQKVNSLKED